MPKAKGKKKAVASAVPLANKPKPARRKVSCAINPLVKHY
jgi:hypothetical protein